MQVTQNITETQGKKKRSTANLSDLANTQLTRLRGKIESETGINISKEELLGELIAEKFERIFGKEAA